MPGGTRGEKYIRGPPGGCWCAAVCRLGAVGAGGGGWHTPAGKPRGWSPPAQLPLTGFLLPSKSLRSPLEWLGLVARHHPDPCWLASRFVSLARGHSRPPESFPDPEPIISPWAVHDGGEFSNAARAAPAMASRRLGRERLRVALWRVVGRIDVTTGVQGVVKRPELGRQGSDWSLWGHDPRNRAQNPQRPWPLPLPLLCFLSFCDSLQAPSSNYSQEGLGSHSHKNPSSGNSLAGGLCHRSDWCLSFHRRSGPLLLLGWCQRPFPLLPPPHARRSEDMLGVLHSYRHFEVLRTSCSILQAKTAHAQTL